MFRNPRYIFFFSFLLVLPGVLFATFGVQLWVNLVFFFGGEQFLLPATWKKEEQEYNLLLESRGTEGNRALLEQSPNRRRYSELLGDLSYSSGNDWQKARSFYEEAYKETPLSRIEKKLSILRQENKETESPKEVPSSVDMHEKTLLSGAVDRLQNDAKNRSQYVQKSSEFLIDDTIQFLNTQEEVVDW
jgi:hypothetical protein